MSNVKKFAKKIVTIGVAFSTMLWSVGVTLMPVAAVAASCPDNVAAGTLIKVSGKPAIYGLDANMNYRYFENGDVFKSWNSDDNYSKYYVTVSQACFDSLMLPGSGPYHIYWRPGSYVVRYLSSDQLYVVQQNGVLAKITPEAAKALYGATHKTMTIGLSEWPYYKTTGTAITETKVHPGMLVSNGGKTWYVDENSVLREVTATGFTANRFKTNFVHPVGASAIAGLGTGSVIDAYMASISDRLMGGSGAPGQPPATGGAMSVSLAADNPAGTTIADGTAYNKMLKVNLMAASKAVKVTSLTITRTGLIANSKVTGISVWDSQGMRHGDVMTSINSNNQVTVGFGSNPVLVAAGTTESLTVAFNIDSTTGSGTVGAEIKAQGDIVSDATSVSGSFPITGNAMTIVDGSASLATMSVTSSAAGGLAASTDTANVSVGDVREVAKFKFTQENGKNDVYIDGVTFYLEGTTKEKDFTNYEVVAPDNTVLGKTEFSNNRYVTIKFDKPYLLPKSTNRILAIKAKVSDGSGNWIRLHVQNDYDVQARDAALGYGILPLHSVTLGAYTDSTDGSTGIFKVKSGSLTVNKTTNSTAGSISVGASDVVFGSFDITAVGEDMEIRKAGLKFTSSSQVLTGNLKLMVDNDTLLTVSADDAALDSGSQRNLSQYFTVKSGQTKVLKVIGNVLSTATNNATGSVSVGNFYAKRLTTLDFADGLPSSSINTSGNTLTVQTTNLTVVKDTTQGNANIAPASTVTLGQYVARAGSAEDVRLTNMVIKFSGGNAGAGDVVQNLELWSEGKKLGTTLSTAATSSNSYSFDLMITKNTSKVITVKGYVTSGITVGGTLITVVDSYNYIGVSTNNTTSATDDVTGQTFTAQSANVLITAASDSTTISAIRLPSNTEVQLGKWKFEAQNQDVSIDRFTFYLANPGDFSTNTTSSNFGVLSLYDASNMVTPLATSEYVGGTDSGYVRFDKTAMTTVAANQSKYLVLKGKINDSGTMTAQSVNAWRVPRSTLSADVQVRDSNGGTLTDGQLDVGALGASDTSATSTWYIFHNSAPKITTVSLGTSLSLNSQASIFKFKIDNPGTRELRISTTTVTVNASGLAAAGSTGTGTIYAFKLWESNEGGGLGAQLATNTMASGNVGCLAGSSLGPMTIGGETCAQASTSSLSLTFGPMNDTNSLLDNLTISAGDSRTFIVTADTTSILTGKTTGSVSVSALLDGATGFSSGDTTNEPQWSNGVITYFYTPVGGSENSTAYSASDSYDVVGGTLVLSV